MSVEHAAHRDQRQRVIVGSEVLVRLHQLERCQILRAEDQRRIGICWRRHFNTDAVDRRGQALTSSQPQITHTHNSIMEVERLWTIRRGQRVACAGQFRTRVNARMSIATEAGWRHLATMPCPQGKVWIDISGTSLARLIGAAGKASRRMPDLFGGSLELHRAMRTRDEIDPRRPACRKHAGKIAPYEAASPQLHLGWVRTGPHHPDRNWRTGRRR